VKCRPPENRPPRPDEVGACNPYLRTQIGVIKPKAIVLLGKTAAETMLGRKVEMGKEHGTVVEKDGIRYLITYHPAAMIYKRTLKDTLVEDYKKISALLAE
jgi:DNA polymerase